RSLASQNAGAGGPGAAGTRLDRHAEGAVFAPGPRRLKGVPDLALTVGAEEAAVVAGAVLADQPKLVRSILRQFGQTFHDERCLAVAFCVEEAAVRRGRLVGLTHHHHRAEVG